ncbi:MAG: methyltransferase [Eubacteriales bacterium]|nr:methyltransferase [Eubacteriales bacterium]
MKTMKLWWLFAAALTAVVLAAFFLAGAWLQGVVLSLMGVFFLLVMAGMNKKALQRAIPAKNPKEPPLLFAQALAFALTGIVSCTDMGKLTDMPGWCLLLGLVLLVFAYILMVQALLANPRHAGEVYGETVAPDNKEQGPYELLRHPCMTALLLAYVGLPLFLCSAVGFIPAALGVVLTVMRVSVVEDYRLRTYSWYSDYAREVSYRIIPFIW